MPTQTLRGIKPCEWRVKYLGSMEIKKGREERVKGSDFYVL